MRISQASGSRSILPEDIDWQLFPAFPPSARLAVMVPPPEVGPCVVRVKVPGREKLMPKNIWKTASTTRGGRR